MKERKTLQEIYLRHEERIKIALIVIIAITCFIVGFLFTWNFMFKPLNDNEFKLCEQVAQDVYAQKENNVIVETPEEYSVDMTATTITVESANPLYRGKVIAKLQNGELVFTRDMETAAAITVSILMGFLFIAVIYVIYEVIYKIYKTIKSVK